MAVCTHHTSCPSCGSRDNLAVYDDGSKWCFGCHFYVPPTLSGFVKAAKLETDDEKTWTLPSDLTQDFPEEVITYANKYSITTAELITNSYYFSRWSGRLWRLLESGSTKSICKGVRGNWDAAEARRLDSGAGKHLGPKSLFFGSKEAVTAIAGTERPSGHLVLCEDSLSSIKVARVTHSAPLFGTSLSMGKLMKFLSYQKVTIWLDHDKFKEAWEIALKFKWLGIETNVILTQHDPKVFSEDEIRGYLNVKST